MSSPSAPGDDLDDPQTLTPEESLDADETDDDPFNRARDDFEAPMDPPEHWVGADKFGTTPNEMSEGETLDMRLDEEVPDIVPDPVPVVPVAVTPLDELDETIDDVAPDGTAADTLGVPTGTGLAPDGEALVTTEATMVREPDEPAADETLTVVGDDDAALGLADTDR